MYESNCKSILYSYRLENLMAHDELYGIGDDCVHRRNEINRRMRSCIQLHERIRVLVR